MSIPESHDSSEDPIVPKQDATDNVGAVRKDVVANIDDLTTLTPDQVKLREMRERGEIDPHDFPWDQIIYFLQEDYPLQKKDLGKQAIMLTRSQMEEIGSFEIFDKKGEKRLIEIEDMNTEILIIFPDDLGDIQTPKVKVEFTEEDPLALIQQSLGLEGQDVMTYEDMSEAEPWLSLIKKTGGDFQAMSKAQAEHMDLRSIHLFLASIIIPQIQKKNFLVAYRQLINSKVAPPELCVSIGLMAIDQFFAKLTHKPKESDLAGIFIKGTEIHTLALKRIEEIEFEGAKVVELLDEELELDEEGEVIMPPVVDVSADMPCSAVWKAFEEKMSSAQYEHFMADLLDENKTIYSVLCEMESMDISVREFSNMTHQTEFGDIQISLEEIQEVLPIRFTDIG